MYLHPVLRRILLAGQPAHFSLSRHRVYFAMQTRSWVVTGGLHFTGQTMHFPLSVHCLAVRLILPRRMEMCSLGCDGGLSAGTQPVCFLPPVCCNVAGVLRCAECRRAYMLCRGNILPAHSPARFSLPTHNRTARAAFTSGHRFDNLPCQKRNKTHRFRFEQNRWVSCVCVSADV